MEAHVAALEQIALDTKQILAEMRQDIRKLQEDVAFIKGRLTQMPNIWQAIALQITFAGLLFAAMRFGLH